VNISYTNGSGSYSGGYRWKYGNGVWTKYVNDDFQFNISGDWMLWDDASNPDMVSPWVWNFSFPDGCGYYEFFSRGASMDVYETLKGSADAGCYLPESKIANTGMTDMRGFLLIQVQFNDSGQWVLADDTINETSARRINASCEVGLDLIFNGLVSTDDLLNGFGSGMYRVYAAFRDPDGNILVNNDDSQMAAWYEFTIENN
jgi:hypothetical protein